MIPSWNEFYNHHNFYDVVFTIALDKLKKNWGKLWKTSLLIVIIHDYFQFIYIDTSDSIFLVNQAYFLLGVIIYDK